MIYVVTAYRWGNTNGGTYLVGATTEWETACTMAQTEVQERGGKYGCEVVCAQPGEARTAYYPSLFGEPEPFRNWRIAAAEAIGLDMMNAVEDGQVLEPDGSGYRLQYRRRKLRVWIARLVKRHMDFERTIAEHVRARRQEQREAAKAVHP